MDMIPTPSQTVGPYLHIGLTDTRSVPRIAAEGAKGERVWLTCRVLDGDDLLDLGSRELRGDAADAGSRNQHRDRAVAAGHRRQLLRGDDGFPGRAIELPVTVLFGDDEDHAITRASSRSRRTSSLAASAGEPPISWVFLPFSGT